MLAIHNHAVLAEGVKKVLNGGGLTSLTAVSLTLPPAVTKEVPAEKRLDEIRDAIVKQYFAKVVEETDITFDSCRASAWIPRDRWASLAWRCA